MEQFCICIPAVATSTQLITPNRKPSLRDLMRQSKPAVTFANLKESWPVCNFVLDLAYRDSNLRPSAQRISL